MTISSRTPEGEPKRCPICGRSIFIEPSLDTRDAPCPICGHLLWWLEERRSKPRLGISADTLLSSLGDDSLDTVELVMELEEEFGLDIPDEDAEGIKTVGDLVRYLEHQGRHGE